jgi:S1-C subfamily serine protease
VPRPDTGLEIAAVAAGGSGARAGLQTGDVLLKVDGQEVTSIESWMRLLRPGKHAVEYWDRRRGVRATTTLEKTTESTGIHIIR